MWMYFDESGNGDYALSQEEALNGILQLAEDLGARLRRRRVARALERLRIAGQPADALGARRLRRLEGHKVGVAGGERGG